MSEAAVEPRLKQVTLVLTEKCNHRCSYCYVPVDRGRSMSGETARRAVDLLLDHAPRVGTATVAFFGGEPFLAAELMNEVADYALARRRLGQKVVFTSPTNATVLDAGALGLIARLRMELAVSVDGDAPERRLANGASSFEAVRFTARALLRMPGLKLTARMTVTPANVGALAANVRAVADLGFGRIVFLPAYEAVWPAAAVATFGEQHEVIADWLLGQARAGRAAPDLPGWRGVLARLEGAPRRHCGAGVSHVAVATDGTIYPCYRTVFDPRGATAVLGHVAGGRGAPEVQRAYAALDPGRPRPQDGDCESCPAQGGCALFCPALGLLLAGDIGIVPRVVCELTRAQVAVVGDFGRRLEDLSARRASGRTVFAASALALALAGASAGCGDRANPGPQGGVCPVYVDGGVGDARTDGPMAGVCADWIDGPVGGVCPVTGSDAAAGDGTALDGSPGDLLTAGDAITPLDGGPVGGLCPVQIGDGGIGGIC